MLAIPAVVFSQNGFLTSGGEYNVTGKLPGDQVHPQIDFRLNGGYVVWEDYFIDGKGLGIGAMRLKSDLSGSGVPFRVNSVAARDQENGQITMLNNGGAAFAWQGGPQGFQHIYSRFLSPSNNWVTGDVQVNSLTNRFQTSPVLATLLNGNVVEIYSSVNQAAANSLQDIYGQIFTPDGQKVGGEFLVNQFTDKNQRSPALVALANGKFAVAWVSEQERWTDVSNGIPSVDIYARLFDNDGSPLGGEFLVNVSSNLCAYPSLAAAQDGGFMAAWMEKDLAVRNNGWDIYSRRFSSAGVGGDVTRVNTQLYGDQLLPRIRRAGTTYLAVWTSLGQDTSREGVFGRFLNDDATVSGNEFQVNTTFFGPQMHQALGSDGTGRFLPVWTSFGLGVNGFDLFVQRYINPSVATNGVDSDAFNTDPNSNSNSVVSVAPYEPVSLPAPADPGEPLTSKRYSFSEVKGTYNGLVYSADNVEAATSGYLTITTTATGGFTARLQMDGQKYSFSGQFNSSGVSISHLGPWTIQLQLDLRGNDRISGQISDGNQSGLLQLNRVIFGKANTTKFAGNYTMVVHPADNTMGAGFGTVAVDASGNVKLSLTLADGTRVSEKTTLSKNGQWPFYCEPYRGGVAIGWIQFGNSATNGFGGTCAWLKPAGVTSPYLEGFTNAVAVSGALYAPTPLAFRNFGPAKLSFSGGGLSSSFTNSVTWGSDNKVVNHSANSLNLSLSSANGLFKGTVVDPASGRSLPFQGVLLERNNVGLGFFPGTGQSGAVSFTPNP